MKKKIGILSIFLVGIPIINARNTEKKDYVKIPKIMKYNIHNLDCYDILKKISDCVIKRNRGKHEGIGQYADRVKELYKLLETYDFCLCPSSPLKQILEESGFYANSLNNETEALYSYNKDLKTSSEKLLENFENKKFLEKSIEKLKGVQFPENYEKKIEGIEKECDKCISLYKNHIHLIQDIAQQKLSGIRKQDLKNSILMLNKIEKEYFDEEIIVRSEKKVEGFRCNNLLLLRTNFFEKLIEINGIKNFAKILNAIDLLKNFIFYKNTNNE